MCINIPNIALNCFYSQYTIFRISCHALTASAELIVKVSKVNVCVCVFQPERIDPSASRQGYDVRSDVWSLGITLVRMMCDLSHGV